MEVVRGRNAIECYKDLRKIYDFDLFTKLREPLYENRFHTREEIFQAVGVRAILITFC